MALMSDLISQGDVGVTFSRCLFLLSSGQDVVQFLFIVFFDTLILWHLLLVSV